MAVKEQVIKEKYCIYNADCIEVMKIMSNESIDFSIYSPPFAGLYQYSSDIRDMSNSINKDEFFDHYTFCVEEITRLTKPGRISAVHCMDIPLSNSGCDTMYDLPGKIIAIHEKYGWHYGGRRVIWKEPLMVRNRTMMKSLHHATLCSDSTKCSIANADYVLMFRHSGENKIPVAHPTGIDYYSGERKVPREILHMRNMKGDQKKNEYSQWIWRQYASCMWDDIRIDHVLDFENARDDEDEKHVHPLQLDVIDRSVILWSNPGEIVLTPFMGVGSEVYSAVVNGRKGIGIELKPSYFRQAIKNMEMASSDSTYKKQKPQGFQF